MSVENLQEYLSSLDKEGKIAYIRSQRVPLLQEVDFKINEMFLNETRDKAAWAAYRQALLVITEPYKSDENKPISDLVWPEKP